MKRWMMVGLVLALIVAAIPVAIPGAVWADEGENCELVDEVLPAEGGMGVVGSMADGLEWGRAFCYDHDVTVNAIDLSMSNEEEAEGDVIVHWYAASGGLPTGSPLVTGTVDALTIDVNWEWVRIRFDDLAMQANVTYCLVVTCDVDKLDWLQKEVDTNMLYVRYPACGMSEWMSAAAMGRSVDGTFRLWNCGGEGPVVPPEEDCHYQDVCVTGLMPEALGPMLRGYLAAADYDRLVLSYGFVWDSVSHPNPDGYPDTYVDTPPLESGYAHYTRTSDGEWYYELSFQSTVDWSSGATYYWRPFVDVGPIGDYIYGPEYVFTMPDCEPECRVVCAVDADDWGGFTAIGNYVSAALQVVELEETAEVTTIDLFLKRDGSVDYVAVGLFVMNEWGEIPDESDMMTSVISEGSHVPGLAGWVRFDLDYPVTLSAETTYAIVLESDPDDYMATIDWYYICGGGGRMGSANHSPGSDWSWYGGCDFGFRLLDCSGARCELLDALSGLPELGLPVAQETQWARLFHYESSKTTNAVELLLALPVGAVDGNVVIEWRSADGGLPSDTVLRTASVDASLVPFAGPDPWGWVRFEYDDLTLTAQGDYWLVVTGDYSWGAMEGEGRPEGPLVAWMAIFIGDEGYPTPLWVQSEALGLSGWTASSGLITPLGGDGFFRLLYCPHEEEEGMAACHEVWGHVPSTFPLWYQAWPSFLKLAYIGVVIVTAVLVFRHEDQPKYPYTPGPEVEGD